MIGSFLSAWVLFPAVLLACSVGGGLLVRRASGGALSAGLLVPVGFALMVVVCAFATSYSFTAPAAGAIAAGFALIGYALELHAGRLRMRQGWLRRSFKARSLWPALAALVAFAAIGGPVLLTGTPTWTGYTRIVDIAFQMDFAHSLASAGRPSPPLDSSYDVMISKFAKSGYPGGGQATLGAFAALLRTDVAWCYQAFLAFTAAMGALAIFSLLGRIATSGPLRALGAAVAIQPNILYGYALEGGIKELTAATLLMSAVAALAERMPGAGSRARRPARRGSDLGLIRLFQLRHSPVVRPDPRRPPRASPSRPTVPIDATSLSAGVCSWQPPSCSRYRAWSRPSRSPRSRAKRSAAS